MKSVEEQALQTYQNNINYFSKEHPEVYKKLNLLNIAIESGQHPERYSLEFKDDSYFDIKELQSGQYLYGTNSNELSKQVEKQVDFSKNKNVIETFYNTPFSKEVSEHFDKQLSLSESPLYAASNIIYYTRQNAPKTTTLKRIEKYIYLGVGIGKHLEYIQNRLECSKILIIENNIEIFRLSLFTTNYENIFKKGKIFLSIAQNDAEFNSTFGAFFIAGYNHNHYLKYSIFSDNYVQKIKQIQDIIVSNSYLSYPYSMLLSVGLKAPQYLIDNYNYINISAHIKESFFKDKPVLFIAAGPSFKKNIEWLKKNQDKFIIVSALATIQTLYEYNIKPDVITNIDGSDILLKFFDGINIDDFLSDTLFMFSSVTNNKIVEKLKKENIFFYESAAKYKQNFGSIAAPSVGEVSYGLLLTLGISELYLLGLDLALDAETKSRYSNKSHDNETNYEEEEDSLGTSLSKNITYVKGNFSKEVPTLPVFKVSINQLNIITKAKKIGSQKVYNLSDGAYFDNIPALHVKDLNTDNFISLHRNEKNYKDSLKYFYREISQNRPNKDDINHIMAQIKEAKWLLKEIEEYKTIKSYSQLDSYLINLAQIINKLVAVNAQQKTIHNMMYNYIRFISTYIFDLFNTKEVKNVKKHIKYINNTFIRQVEKMLNIYIKTLETYYEVYSRNEGK